LGEGGTTGIKGGMRFHSAVLISLR
jgi:hypothetical protein